MIVQFQNPTAKRFALAITLAVLGAIALTVFAAPAEAQVVIKNPCLGKTPSDWEYWMYSCWAM